MTEPKHIPLPDFARFVEERAHRLAEAIDWVFGIDDRPVMDDDVTEEEPETYCNGICITAGELGLPYGGVAYAHPDCDLHGEAESDA